MFIFGVWCDSSEDEKTVIETLCSLPKHESFILKTLYGNDGGRIENNDSHSIELFYPNIDKEEAERRINALKTSFANTVRKKFLFKMTDQSKKEEFMVKFNDFTEEQKNELAEICKILYESSNRARREGILALEDGIDSFTEKLPGMNGIFLTKLMRYVVDGTDGVVISQIADNYIASSCENDYEKLCFTLLKSGVLSIQCGDNPRILTELLISRIGLAGEEDFRKRTGFNYDD